MAVSLLSKALAKVLSTGSGMAMVIGVGCSLVLGTGNAYGAAEKDSAMFFNPKPQDDDVIVPMPCKGFMVFKKVYTSNEDKLHDKGFSAGSNNADSLLTQAPNSRYIQGAFKDKQGYYYLIGKYELNSAQYDILSSYDLGKGKCEQKKLSPKDRIAKSNISWFDAVEVTRQYSHFLASKAAQQALKEVKGSQIPTGGNNTIAFVRLPTDSEWEFAARGGNSVTSSQFSADVFPFEKDKTIADYAWYKGQGSAPDGKVRAIGLKQPNPLGLYDILGNVSEMMLDPFYATRTGRLHGQSGGYVVRGGSVFSGQDDMITAYRSERAYFTRGSETKSRDMGMRLVLSLPFTNSIDEVRSLNEQVAKLGNDDNSDTKGGGNLNTIGELDKIIAEQKQAQQKAEQDRKAAQQAAHKAREEAQKAVLLAKEEVQKATEQAQKQADSDIKQAKLEQEKLQKELALSQKELELSQQEAAKAQKERDDLGAYLMSMQQNLHKLRANMIEANAKKEEMRDRAIVSNLRLGGYLCSTIAREEIARERYAQREEILRKVPLKECRADNQSKECLKATEQQELKFKQDRALVDHMVDYYVSYYADHITDTMNTFDYKFIKEQLKNAQQSLGKNEGTLSEYIAQFLNDLDKHQRAGRDLEANKKLWIKQCRALKH